MAQSPKLADDSEFSLDDIVLSPDKNNINGSSTSSSSKESNSSSSSGLRKSDLKTNESTLFDSSKKANNNASTQPSSVTLSSASIVGNLKRKKHRNSVGTGKNSTRYLLGTLLQKVSKGPDNIEEVVAAGGVVNIINAITDHSDDKQIVILALSSLSKISMVETGASILANEHYIAVLNDSIHNFSSNDKIGKLVADVLTNTIQNEKRADTGNHVRFFSSCFRLLVDLFELYVTNQAVTGIVLSSMDHLVHSGADVDKLANTGDCLYRYSEYLSKLETNSNPHKHGTSMLKLLLDSGVGAETRTIELFRKIQSHVSLKNTKIVQNYILSLYSFCELENNREALLVADGMRFVVSLLPDYPTFAFRLVQILTRSPNGIKSLSMAVFAPRRLRETVNAKIAVIVLDYICKVDASSLGNVLPVTKESAIQAVQQLLSRANQMEDSNLKRAALDALAHLPDAAEIKADSLSDLQMAKSACVELDIADEREDEASAGKAIQMLNSLLKSPEILFELEEQHIASSLNSVLKTFSKVSRATLALITGDPVVFDLSEKEYQKKLLDVHETLKIVLDHQHWVAKAKNNLESLVHRVSSVNEGSGLFSLIQSASLPVVEYLIDHNIGVHKAQASGSVLKLTLSVDKAAADLVARKHEVKGLHEDDLSRSKAELMEEKTKGLAIKKSLVNAQSRIEALSVQIEALMKKTAEREEQWTMKMGALKQRQGEYIAGLSTSHAMELAEKEQEIQSLVSTSSGNLGASSQMRSKREFKSKMRDLNRSHLIKIEELETSHKLEIEALNTSWGQKLQDSSFGGGDDSMSVSVKKLTMELEQERALVTQLRERQSQDTPVKSRVVPASDIEKQLNRISKEYEISKNVISALKQQHKAEMLSLQEQKQFVPAETDSSDQYEELLRKYQSKCDEFNDLKENTDQYVTQGIDNAVAEYKKVMIQVVQNQASETKRQAISASKNSLRSAIERERHTHVLEMEQMKQDLQEDMHHSLKEAAYQSAQQEASAVFTEEISRIKTECHLEVMKSIKRSVSMNENTNQISLNSVVAEAVRLEKKAARKIIDEEVQFAILEAKTSSENKISQLTDQFESHVQNVELTSDKALALMKSELDKTLSNLAEAQKKYSELQSRLAHQKEIVAVEIEKVKEEVKTEQAAITELAMEDMVLELQREKKVAVSDAKLVTEAKLRKQFKAEMYTRLEEQERLHELDKSTLLRKLEEQSHDLKSHQNIASSFDVELQGMQMTMRQKHDSVIALESELAALQKSENVLKEAGREDKKQMENLQNQIRGALEKVAAAREEESERAKEAEELRHTKNMVEQTLTERERDLAIAHTRHDALQKEANTFKTYLARANEELLAAQSDLELQRKETVKLLELQNIDQPKLDAYRATVKELTETKDKLEKATKDLNFLSGKVQILEQKLAREQNDTGTLRKSLAEMEESLFNTSSVLEARVHDSKTKRNDENFVSYYDRRKQIKDQEDVSFPSASEESSEEEEDGYNEDLVETALISMHSKSFLKDDDSDSLSPSGKPVPSAESTTLEIENEDFDETALVLMHSKSFLQEDSDDELSRDKIGTISRLEVESLSAENRDALEVADFKARNGLQKQEGDIEDKDPAIISGYETNYEKMQRGYESKHDKLQNEHDRMGDHHETLQRKKLEHQREIVAIQKTEHDKKSALSKHKNRVAQLENEQVRLKDHHEVVLKGINLEHQEEIMAMRLENERLRQEISSPIKIAAVDVQEQIKHSKQKFQATELAPSKTLGVKQKQVSSADTNEENKINRHIRHSSFTLADDSSDSEKAGPNRKVRIENRISMENKSSPKSIPSPDTRVPKDELKGLGDSPLSGPTAVVPERAKKAVSFTLKKDQKPGAKSFSDRVNAAASKMREIEAKHTDLRSENKTIYKIALEADLAERQKVRDEEQKVRVEASLRPLRQVFEAGQGNMSKLPLSSSLDIQPDLPSHAKFHEVERRHKQVDPMLYNRIYRRATVIVNPSIYDYSPHSEYKEQDVLESESEEDDTSEKKSDIVASLHDFLRSIGLDNPNSRKKPEFETRMDRKKSKKHKKGRKRELKKAKKKKKKSRKKERKDEKKVFTQISGNDESSPDLEILKKFHSQGAGSDYWIHSPEFWDDGR